MLSQLGRGLAILCHMWGDIWWHLSTSSPLQSIFGWGRLGWLKAHFHASNEGISVQATSSNGCSCGSLWRLWKLRPCHQTASPLNEPHCVSYIVPILSNLSCLEDCKHCGEPFKQVLWTKVILKEKMMKCELDHVPTFTPHGKNAMTPRLLLWSTKPLQSRKRGLATRAELEHFGQAREKSTTSHNLDRQTDLKAPNDQVQ